ncbi:acyl-CoA dehydrogenase family protein [Geomicrobium sp. JCM 19038]|uniref:acyl-CoA dehydrogenase family protein n=2 Tax=unclassified Geomicrobium TaxID=2628951 RepID=UPI00045F271D|nr:acyl-CoA dehydrogenase family protein [Geomicrobium sp. JCM 19038]GAK10364.1 butyryl-CoA dehydrogenase [Geomicrobium sp. JCM 19038]
MSDMFALSNQQERKEFLAKTVEAFAERAHQHDAEGSFPHENFTTLKSIRYPGLSVPKEYGGKGISLTELLELQEIIAKADGSTALAIGWHMGIIMTLGEKRTWDDEVYREVVSDVIENGALLNNAASELATGSPTRGGKPETTAVKVDGGYEITGRKTFTTLAPTLDYFVVSAAIEGSDEVGNFLIRRDLDGVAVKNTWDTLGMRATGSDDLILNRVIVRDKDYVETLTPGFKDAAGWLLHIPVTYLGIATAALSYSASAANNHSPNSIDGTIADLPNVQQKIGEAELLRVRNRHFLYAVSKKWDESSNEERNNMKLELGAVKHSVVNDAQTIVDLSMRVVGARSLATGNPLGRYYRDVRAGLHNPPMDDMTITQLAKATFERNP